MGWRHIAISGELGSGKSTLAKLVARELGMRFMSTGSLQRQIAAERSPTTFETNRPAAHDESMDATLDNMLMAEGASPESTVFDSRLAWHFVPRALRIHLLVDPLVGAERLAQRPGTAVESYEDIEKALEAADSRSSLERARFEQKYAVDITNLTNYDLVIDSSDATPSKLCEVVCHHFTSGDATPAIYVDPQRIIPTGDCVRALPSDIPNLESDPGPFRVHYSRPDLFVTEDYRILSRHVLRNDALVRAQLVDVGASSMPGGLTPHEYLIGETRLSWLYDWEDAHGFQFKRYPVGLR